MEARWVRCRARREMEDARVITTKNGRPATQGGCRSCGTKVFGVGKAWRPVPQAGLGSPFFASGQAE